MQPVTLLSDVGSVGSLGFSALQFQLDGTVKRMTMLILRDRDGRPRSCVIAPAETLV
jgi:hypothetical protein